jgi:hypothetical protein
MPKKRLTKSDILAGLRELGRLAEAEGVSLEAALYGGAVMMLAYDARPSTKDVDAIIHPPKVAKRLAARVAGHFGWADDWLNDDVRRFVSGTETKLKWNLPDLACPALKLSRPTAKYLLAMKVMACRRPLPGYPGDEGDIAFLLKKMGIADVATVEEIVNQYFPDTVLPATTVRTVEHLLARQKS